ncbi:MAG TPA: N-acetylmuramidase domain-containing protein, partial [Acetobacteraceae bacterium]|nr:N-acetylmuramidase domain-containing protein [Acetobacteraceae bacterium]
MTDITAGVGNGAPNVKTDVAWVQTALARHARWLSPLAAPPVTGTLDPETTRAILQFQATAAALAHPDGVVSPRGFTVKQLARVLIPYPANPIFSPVCWNHTGDALTAADYTAAAATLGCQAAAIQAVAQTETKRAAWDDLGRPTILYERHYFSRLSGHLYDATHPDISSRHAYQRATAGVSADNVYGPTR